MFKDYYYKVYILNFRLRSFTYIDISFADNIHWGCSSTFVGKDIIVKNRHCDTGKKQKQKLKENDEIITE